MFSCWCNKLFLSSAILNWHKKLWCVGVCVGGVWVEVDSTLNQPACKVEDVAMEDLEGMVRRMQRQGLATCMHAGPYFVMVG